MKNLLLRVVLLTIVFGAWPGLGYSDTYLKQHRTTQGGVGASEAEDNTEEIWMTSEGVRSDNPKESMIMVLNENKMYMLNHEDKTYSGISLNVGQAMDEIVGEGEGKAMMSGMMKNMIKVEATVQTTGETKKIRDWNCQKYLVTLTTMMGPSTQEVWASEDIKVDQALYERLSSANNAMMPGMGESMSQMVEEMKKIKGFHVLNTSTQTVMNKTMTTVVELLEYRQGPAPKGLFQIPADYKKVSTPDFFKRERPASTDKPGRQKLGFPEDMNLDKLLAK
jgi:hypothetical protein